MKLCARRAFWLVAYPSQGHEMLFDAHTRSFIGLGGVPRCGIYDNMETAVDKVNKGKWVSSRLYPTRIQVVAGLAQPVGAKNAVLPSEHDKYAKKRDNHSITTITPQSPDIQFE